MWGGNGNGRGRCNAPEEAERGGGPEIRQSRLQAGLLRQNHADAVAAGAAADQSGWGFRGTGLGSESGLGEREEEPAEKQQGSRCGRWAVRGCGGRSAPLATMRMPRTATTTEPAGQPKSSGGAQSPGDGLGLLAASGRHGILQPRQRTQSRERDFAKDGSCARRGKKLRSGGGW